MLRVIQQRWRLVRICLAVALSAHVAYSATNTLAQSGSRSKTSTSRSPQLLSAEPHPQDASPFFPPMGVVQRLPLAVHGHCIVSLRDQQQWDLGSERYQAVFDGQLYWFAGARERAMFLAAPIRYAIFLGGDCAVTYAESNQRKPGRPEYGLLHQKKLFFFAGSDQRHRFQQNPERFRDADLVGQGFCVVSRIDDDRRLPGTPDAMAVVGGLRYQFVGAHQRNLFLRNLKHYGAKLHTRPTAGTMAKGPNAGGNPALSGQDIAKHLAKAKPLSEAPEGEKPLTMLSGFCPVSMLDLGLWDRGKYKHRCRYDGQTYLLASEEKRQRFLENPAHYVPALAGNCAVTYRELGKLVSGKNDFTVLYQDRLFLFADAEKKKAFKDDPKMLAKVDLANDGLCIVTQREEGKQMAGNPLYLTWHQGKRYWFAAQEQKEKFLADPKAYF